MHCLCRTGALKSCFSDAKRLGAKRALAWQAEDGGAESMLVAPLAAFLMHARGARVELARRVVHVKKFAKNDEEKQ